jgi:hypothetical protein
MILCATIGCVDKVAAYLKAVSCLRRETSTVVHAPYTM